MSEFSQFKFTPSSSPIDVKDAVARQQLQSTQTASGNPLTLNDAAPINAESLVVELEPKQDLHGQSAPYVGGAGKNKLPMTVDGIKDANTSGTWSENTYTLNGVTFTILTDDSGNVTGIKANGTASANSTLIIVKAFYPSAERYIVNGCPSGGSITTYRIRDNYNGFFEDVGNGATFNYTSGRIDCVIDIISGYNAQNLIFYPMIRLSTETDPTFAPYSNICPITGYTGCEVDDVGINQWDEEWEVGNLDNTTGQTDSTAGYIRSKNFCKCKGNENYCAKAPTADSMRVFWYDSGNNFIESVSIPQNNRVVITSPSNAAYFKLKTYATTYNRDISINYPSTFTEYEPYHSSNASIQFGQTVYGGRSNFTEGGTEKSMDLFDAGEATWSYTNGRFYTQKPCKSYTQATVAVLLCSQYQTVSYQAQGTTDKTISSYAGYIYVRDDSFNGDPIAFTTAMDGVQICYTLAIPTSIATPPTDLKLLKGTNNITSNGTTINLGYQPDNVIGELKGEIQDLWDYVLAH